MSRKDDIISAAVILFAENGYSATPTSAVAKKAGVAEGLIFHHFKNKAGILIYIFTELSEVYIREVEKLKLVLVPCWQWCVFTLNLRKTNQQNLKCCCAISLLNLPYPIRKPERSLPSI